VTAVGSRARLNPSHLNTTGYQFGREFSLTEDAARRTRGHLGCGGRDQRGFVSGLSWCSNLREQSLTWLAQRRDDRATVRTDNPVQLRFKITADYAARPVPRGVYLEGGPVTRVTSKSGVSLTERAFHAFMIMATCGLQWPVYRAVKHPTDRTTTTILP
jgi:hypothetical protein